jgi:hypothetical protein
MQSYAKNQNSLAFIPIELYFLRQYKDTFFLCHKQTENQQIKQSTSNINLFVFAYITYQFLRNYTKMNKY